MEKYNKTTILMKKQLNFIHFKKPSLTKKTNNGSTDNVIKMKREFLSLMDSVSM